MMNKMWDENKNEWKITAFELAIILSEVGNKNLTVKEVIQRLEKLESKANMTETTLNSIY